MSAKTYRLPEVLGGGEIEGRTDYVGAALTPQLIGFCIDGSWAYVANALLTEVVPPLPEEPPNRAVVVCTDDVGEPWVFERLDGYDGKAGPWATTAEFGGYSWAEVCAKDVKGTPVRLVPEPVVEPVTLPWKSHGVEVQQTTLDSGPGNHVHVSTKDASYGFAHLKPSVAREMARALNAAADAVERAS